MLKEPVAWPQRPMPADAAVLLGAQESRPTHNSGAHLNLTRFGPIKTYARRRRNVPSKKGRDCGTSDRGRTRRESGALHRTRKGKDGGVNPPLQERRKRQIRAGRRPQGGTTSTLDGRQCPNWNSAAEASHAARWRTSRPRFSAEKNRVAHNSISCCGGMR